MAMKYLGIDLGDGETAVAMVSGDGAILPRVLNLGNTRSILSLVGKDKDGGIVVGENVLLDFQMKHRSARFKSRFLRDEKASMDILDFAKGVYDLLEKDLSAIKPADMKIALGCPAGWSESDRERYRATVTLAGFPNVYTVSESRAAFMYANHSRDLGLTAAQLSRPSLVIDIGSSTTDFAHIVEGREANVGIFGDNNLGGGLLDQYLLEEMVAASGQAEALTSIFAQYPVWRSYCEMDARKVKEAYFIAQSDGDEQPTANRNSHVYLDVYNPIVLPMTVNDEVIRKVLNRPLPELKKRSFIQALDEALKKAQAVTADYPPEVVILTGGASRMQFFRDACVKAFPEAMMVICPEPEYSIAYGLSVAARTDHALSLFRADVDQFFDNPDLLRPEIIRHLPALQTELTPILSKAVRAGLAAMMGQAKGLKRQQMATLFGELAQQHLNTNEVRQDVSQTVSRWVANNMGVLQQHLNVLCDRYYIDRMDVALAQMHMDYPVEQLKLPFSAYMIAAFGKVKIFNWMARKMTALLENSMAKQIRQELLDPHGKTAQQLCASLESEMKRMINQRIAGIELLIH